MRLPSGSQARTDAIRRFCKTFVPDDVNEDDTLYFADQLASDDQHFLRLTMELRQVCLDCVLAPTNSAGASQLPSWVCVGDSAPQVFVCLK